MTYLDEKLGAIIVSYHDACTVIVTFVYKRRTTNDSAMHS